MEQIGKESLTDEELFAKSKQIMKDLLITLGKRLEYFINHVKILNEEHEYTEELFEKEMFREWLLNGEDKRKKIIYQYHEEKFERKHRHDLRLLYYKTKIEGLKKRIKDFEIQ